MPDQISSEWPDAVDVMCGGVNLRHSPDAKVALVFKNRAAAFNILAAKDILALAESYVDGELEIEGDIYAAIKIKDHFYPENPSLVDKGRTVFSVLRNRRRHSVKNDGENIRHHYDHPDEFYALFLGRTMTYSCAYFCAEASTLEQAQENKIDHLMAKLNIKSGERLLDVGCGWGSLAVRAAAEFGADVLGVTLSRTQHAYANRQIEAMGLARSCRVELIDYRQIPLVPKFDKIVSVGMYEHVGSRNLDFYFQRIFDLLRPDGIFVNHGITRKFRADWKKAGEAIFIDKYIFPGGEIHPGSRVVTGMERAGFEIFDVESLRKHYARTLRCWVERLEKNRDRALDLVPEEVYRAWRLYMAGCAVAFEEGYLNVHQAAGSKTEPYGGAEIPLTREYLYRNKKYV